jgi:hypothetical protein
MNNDSTPVVNNSGETPPFFWTGGSSGSYQYPPSQPALHHINYGMLNEFGWMPTPSVYSSKPRSPHNSNQDLRPGGLDTADRVHRCRYCERVFAHESSKCRHEKEHFNSFPCPEAGCDVVSSRKDSMKRHLRLMHGISDGSPSTSGNPSGGMALSPHASAMTNMV